MRTFDVVVVGAGAAGLMAAGTASQQGFRTLLIEKMEKPARKVRITGKGRCNLTNTKPLPEFLEKVRVNREFAGSFLRYFSNMKTMQFFEKAGLKLVTERGDRVFPASGKAWDVANTLETWAHGRGATVECNTSAVRIETEGNQIRSITVRNKKNRLETIQTTYVILATGGASYPATGSTGDGYKLAHELGHRIVEIRPSLVPLEIDPKLNRELAELKLRNINLTLYVEGVAAGSEFGELEFTENTIGGAIVLRVSREAVDALIDRKRVEIAIDLKPALSREQLFDRIEREVSGLPTEALVKDMMRKLLLQKLIVPIARQAKIDPNGPLAGMTRQEQERLIAALKDFRLEVTDYRPFEEAIVTAGGVDVSEVDPRTLQSKIVSGLYFAGEVLDVDANTGGYNLQLAFSSGRLAGSLKE